MHRGALVSRTTVQTRFEPSATPNPTAAPTTLAATPTLVTSP